MIPKNFEFWSRDFWLPEGVDWEHIEDYEKEENLKAANVKDLVPVIYLTIALYFARIIFEKSFGKMAASFMGVKVRINGGWKNTRASWSRGEEQSKIRLILL